MNEKVPQHIPFHFLSGSSKICFFEESFEMRRSSEHEITSGCSDPSLCWCGSDSTGPPESDHEANGRVEMDGCTRSGTTVHNTSGLS